ncbi:2-iminobutanoate/2-iminopropanoate deaminase [Pararobbsia alpina]
MASLSCVTLFVSFVRVAAVRRVRVSFITYVFTELNMAIQRFHVGPRLSEIAIHNGTVYLAGQIAENADLDIVGQTQEVLASIDRLLAEANSDKSLILSTQIYLADMADFAGMNSVWESWVVQGATPPRATVEAKLANPKCKVELVIVAAQKD